MYVGNSLFVLSLSRDKYKNDGIIIKCIRYNKDDRWSTGEYELLKLLGVHGIIPNEIKFHFIPKIKHK